MRLPAVLLMIALFAFGCVGSGLTGGVVSQSEARLMNAPAASPVPYAASGTTVTQASYITIMVPQGTLDQRFDEIKGKLAAQSAQTSDVSYTEYSDRRQYTLTVKVPPARFDGINTMLKGEGEVKDMSVQLQDVTKQYTDLDTRITNSQLELERLQQLYNQSDNVSDLLQVEREITRVETNLELLTQQKQELVSQVEMSTIVITVYEAKPATTQLSLSLESLGAMFFNALAAAITLIVLAAGFLIPLGIVGGLAWLAYKALRGDRKARPRQPEHSRIPPQQ
jgi:hypothetical protein